MKKEIKTTAKETETPTIPVAFLTDELNTRAYEVLMSYLKEQEAPSEVIELVMCLSWGELYARTAIENNGVLPNHYEEDAPAWLVLYLNSLLKVEREIET